MRQELKLEPNDRVCLIGDAKRTVAETSEQVQRITERPNSTSAGFLGGGVNEVTGVAEITLEAIDAVTREQLETELGPDIELHVFVELLDAVLPEMPLPKERGEVPLATGNSRVQTGMMSALGRFEFHFDEIQRCVYLLNPHDNERVMPILPLGYQVALAPPRLLDFDGNVVANAGQLSNWGGGNSGPPSEAFRKHACGAVHTWSGHPSVN